MQMRVKKLWSIFMILAVLFSINIFAQEADADKKEETAAAEEKAEEKAPTPVYAKKEHVFLEVTEDGSEKAFDLAAFEKAVSEADEEDGVKTAAAVVILKETSSTGVTSSKFLKAEGTIDKEGNFTVAYTELGTDGWFNTSNVWMMLCAALVFMMHLGFASLESGLTRAKNTTNILAKNTAIIAIGILTFAIIGWNLAYPCGNWMVEGIVPAIVFGVDASGVASTPAYGVLDDYVYPVWTDFLFQAMFAATAATIVSGAVAGRIKLGSFLIFSTIYVGICYPIVVGWYWGGGIFDTWGFKDFAGSTIVHSVGGWAALICAFILGPRIGKYVDGKSRPIMGHNLPLAAIGVFLLWLGWFGFNGGSVLSADAATTSRVLVTTNLAAAAGVLGALATSWIVQKKPDLTMMLNGALAGLVGITAGADVIAPLWSAVVGLIAGIIVVISVLVIDQKLKVDDPVGAISVHLVCGIFGTLAAGFSPFLLDAAKADASLFAQIKCIAVTAVFCLVTAGVLFYLLKVTLGVRVHEEEEVRGLDISEHGMEAYGGFQIFSNQ